MDDASPSLGQVLAMWQIYRTQTECATDGVHTEEAYYLFGGKMK
jgi:hypothetical protein